MACGLSHALDTLGVCGGVRVRSRASYAEACIRMNYTVYTHIIIRIIPSLESRIFKNFLKILGQRNPIGRLGG